MGLTKLKTLTAKYMPDCGKDKKTHAFWGREDQEEQDKERGCIPVLDENKKQVKYGGMLAYRVPNK